MLASVLSLVAGQKWEIKQSKNLYPMMSFSVFPLQLTGKRNKLGLKMWRQHFWSWIPTLHTVLHWTHPCLCSCYSFLLEYSHCFFPTAHLHEHLVKLREVCAHICINMWTNHPVKVLLRSFMPVLISHVSGWLQLSNLSLLLVPLSTVKPSILYIYSPGHRKCLRHTDKMYHNKASGKKG